MWQTDAVWQTVQYLLVRQQAELQEWSLLQEERSLRGQWLPPLRSVLSGGCMGKPGISRAHLLCQGSESRKCFVTWCILLSTEERVRGSIIGE